MQVSRAQIVVRGLTNCCPNCGARTLFKAGTFFQINKECALPHHLPANGGKGRAGEDDNG